MLIAPGEAGWIAADGAGLLVAVVGAAGIEASWLSGQSGKIARTCDWAEVWRSGQVDVLMATTAAASMRCVAGGEANAQSILDGDALDVFEVDTLGDVEVDALGVFGGDAIGVLGETRLAFWRETRLAF